MCTYIENWVHFIISLYPLYHQVWIHIFYTCDSWYIQKRIWKENDLSASCHFINEQPIHHSLCIANAQEEEGEKKKLWCHHMRTNVATCNLHPMAFLLVATHIQPICTIVWTHPHMHMKIPAHIEECKILLQLNIHLVGKFLNAAPKKGVGFEPTTCTSMHWKMFQVVTFIDSIVFKYFNVILNCLTASSKTFWWRKWFFMRRSNYIYLGSKEKKNNSNFPNSSKSPLCFSLHRSIILLYSGTPIQWNFLICPKILNFP